MGCYQQVNKKDFFSCKSPNELISAISNQLTLINIKTSKYVSENNQNIAGRLSVDTDKSNKSNTSDKVEKQEKQIDEKEYIFYSTLHKYLVRIKFMIETYQNSISKDKKLDLDVYKELLNEFFDCEETLDVYSLEIVKVKLDALNS